MIPDWLSQAQDIYPIALAFAAQDIQSTRGFDWYEAKLKRQLEDYKRTINFEGGEE